MFKSKDYKEKQLRYSIRKVSFGAASVAISALYLLMGSAAVSASEVQAVNGDQTTVTNPAAKDNEDKSRIENNGITTEETNSSVVTLDRTSLTKLIEEIDGKFTNGKFASKTEDSVNQLKAALEEAKTTLSSATKQSELTSAHAKLIVATTKLQTKPEEKKQAPAVDTTNGKATVGIKATNTEKAADTNSIANSGSRDERNGKALEKNNPFRTDADTANTDTAANQTYTAPAENADLATLADKLKTLPNYIENNKKVQDMDTLGNALNVEKGSVKEINEFGGWKAVGDSGKFAIARATDKGVFPIETVNVLSNNQAWIEEQSFDKSSKYMLFLSKVRTKANRTDESYDGSQYKESGEGGPRGAWVAKGTKGFDGIEKTFRAYNPKEGTTVKIKFKTGYTGIIEDARGSEKSRAKYKVTVFDTTDGKNNEIYSVSFDPGTNIKNNEMTVVAAKNGSGGNVRVNGTSEQAKNAALETMSQSRYKSGSGGTFESKDIVLAPGVKTYKVIISSADNLELGMSYQSSFLQYALPVTGLDYSIDQDTSAIAKNLLQRVYDKLKETEERDIKGKTDETVNAYKAQLESVKNLLAGDLKKTQDYKDIVTAVLDGQQALRTDKSKLTASNNSLLGLINEDPDPRIGKTPISKEPYNTAKDEAIKAQTKAQTILDQENPDPDVVAAAVSKLNEKLAELKAARAELVVAATDAQKIKLAADKVKLVEASKEGKTQDSINAYEARYNALKSELDTAVAAANDVANAQENASKVSALEAQEKVTEVLTKLEEAKALLKDKATDAQIAELKKAEQALTPISDDNLGNKKPTSVQKYKDAVAAIQQELTETKAKVAELLEKAKTDNAAKEEASQLISKVDALKSKLTDAATLLEDKANTGGLETAKNELKEAVAEEVTAGKTPETVGLYNTAKQAADEAVKAAEAVLSNPNATQDAVNAALQTVTEKKAALAAAKKALVDKITQDQKDDLANTEENLKLADTTGKAKDSVKAYNDEVAKLSEELAAAKQAAKDLLDKGDNAGELEAYRVQAKINKLKSKLAEAAKLLKDIDKSAAKKEIEDAAKNANDAIDDNANLTPEQKETAKAKVAEEATKAIGEIDKATTEDDVTAAKNAGKFAIEKEAAKAEVEAAKAAKEKAIDANDKLSDDEKQAAKDAVEEAATNAIQAIDAAQDQSTVDSVKTTGKEAVEAVNPVGKEKALDAIQKATEDKLSEIDRDDKLSDKEKDKAKAEVAKAAIEAVNAINAATDQASVDAKQTEGTKAVSEVNPVGKDKAKAEIEKSLSEKTNAIDANSDLTDEQKAEAKAKIADEAKKAIDAIDKATTTEDVAAAKESGKLAIEKEAAKAEIEAAKAAKEKAIDANPDLTDDEKATAKERVEEEAEAAKNAIDKATELSDIDKVTETGKDDIKKVTVTSAKEEAKKAIDKALEEKEKAIDARTDLTEEEKEAAKKAAREEAEAAKNAIDKATTLEDINKVLEDGKENIAKINLENLKDKAKKAIDEALAAKEKAIDARTDLTEEEKEAAKKAAREEAEAAKNAIDKATTSEDINKVLEDGKENIAKINPENLKDKAKKAIDEALAAKEKAIDARTDLTQEEKEAAKKAAREEAEAAKNAIDKATTSEDINKVLEDGKENIAKINPVGAKEGALAFEGSLQASVTGVVKVELGKAITQANIIAKLNLPESITVISIDLPDTTTLGRKFAKVTLRLADGKETTVFVPVEVVESSKEDKQQNNTQEDSKPTVVPSNNSEQPTVTQTKDVKENPSNTSQESKGSNQKVLPNTGTGNEVSIFGSAAMTVLASLGLVATSKKKEEE